MSEATKQSRRVTRDDLTKMGCPEPTDTWFPFSHERVLYTFCDVLTVNGIELLAESLSVSANQQQFFAVLDIQLPIMGGVRMAAGLRNSTDKTLSVGVFTGERVALCDNLGYWCDFALFRRHNAGIEPNLTPTMMSCVDQMKSMAETRRGQIEWMMNRHVNAERAHHLAVLSVDCEALRARDLGAMLEHWRRPAHAAFETPTLWSFYNAVTATNRQHFDRFGLAAANRTMQLNSLLSRVYGMSLGGTTYNESEVLNVKDN